MTTRPNRQLRRQLESELRNASDFQVTPPPADLLAKIRAEIPADLRAANSETPEPAERRRFFNSSGFRLAASIAVAVVGVALGYRVLDRSEGREARPAFAAESDSQNLKGVSLETAPVDQPRRKIDDRDELLPLKGKTKDVGEGAAQLDRRAKEARDLLEPVQTEISEPLEKIVASRSSTTPTPPPTASAKPVVEPQQLQALGYMGGTVAESAPARLRQDKPPSAPAAAPAAAPSARDPWAVLQTTPGTVVDRVNVGGNKSSQEKQKRASTGQGNDETSSTWSVDGVEITDSGAIGSSSSHYDFDAFEELHVTTGAPSTGGAKEPNERAAGDMFFRPVETNPFVDTAEDRLSTFALDVDTGSWTLARSYLERGALPPAEAIRVEEFVNAQAYDDPAPRRGDFTLVAEGAPSPFAPGEGYRLVRFAVKAREIDARDRKPANLTFVVDVSGSMSQENRLGLVKRALGLLLDELRGDDRVALVVYGSQGRVLLRHTRDHEAIRAAIAALRPEGSTNAEEGLRFGYDLADEAWRKESINRVILCSDGVANVGATGPESILARIGEEARRGIELTTVGFGMGNYNDALMEQLADQGDGAYHYVDTLDEARRIFVENLTGTLQTVAKDAKVQVEFDPKTVDRWRLIGYENRDVADRDFRNDAVDAGEIGVGHSAVALYEIRLKESARDGDPIGTLHLRWKSRATKSVEEAALRLEVGDLEDSFRRASANLRTAAVAAELAERLKRSYWAKEGTWSDLLRAAQRLESERGRDGVPLADTIQRAQRLAGERIAEPEPERELELERQNRERLEED